MLLHPIIQGVSVALALGALLLGLQRVRSLHLHQQVRFRRNVHARLGTLAVGGLLIGAGIGLAMTRVAWGRSFMTMGHGVGGMITLSLFLVGGATGWVLYRKPKKRNWLPAVHGLANAAGVLSALHQVRTGIEVYRTFATGL